MVAAQEKIAAQIGRDVLSRGGNAIDAAVATGFAMAVTYPRAGNIGGGGFMMIHLASGEDVAIDYRESAPAAATRDMFLGDDGKSRMRKITRPGTRHWSAGHRRRLALALEKYGSGKFKLADLIAPQSARRDGFVIADDTAGTLPDWHRRLAKWPSSARFSLAPTAHRATGDRLIQNDLAAHWKRFGARCAWVTKGCRRQAAAIQAAGGIMTR